MTTTRIYQCRGGACHWRGSIDSMPVVECPLCGGGYLEYVGDAPADEEATEEPGRTIFTSRRTRDREAEMDEKTERKRPGVFERVSGKLLFRRSV